MKTALHIGHLSLISNQGVMQSTWNICPQDTWTLKSLSMKLSLQTEQANCCWTAESLASNFLRTKVSSTSLGVETCWFLLKKLSQIIREKLESLQVKISGVRILKLKIKRKRSVERVWQLEHLLRKKGDWSRGYLLVDFLVFVPAVGRQADFVTQLSVQLIQNYKWDNGNWN